MPTSSKPKPPSAVTLCLVWLTIAAIIAISVSWLWRNSPVTAKATAFRQTEQGWLALPALGPGVQDIRVSDSGAVWVLTPRGLSRLVGANWYRFTSADFGTSRSLLPGGFALDGDDLWAAAADGVVHFDGARWRCYKEAVATTRASSIAARDGHVWVVDTSGNLSHFDGATWTIRPIVIPTNWGGRYPPTPKLAITSDGTLWLVFKGLWRYDGQSWTRISGTTTGARLVGVSEAGEFYAHGAKVESGGAIWLRDGYLIVAFNTYGSLWARYRMQDIGLPDNALVSAIAGRTPAVAVATNRGLAWFDGVQWHHDSLATLGIGRVSSITVAPDLSVWGVGYPPYRSIGALDVLIACSALSLPLLFLFAIGLSQQRRGVGPGRIGVRRKPWMLVCVFLLGAPLFYYFHPPRRFLILIAAVSAAEAYDYLRCRSVERALRAGQYQHALAILDGPLRFPNSGLWRLLRAQVLFYWDQARDAEPILRDLAESRRQSAHKAMVAENLGGVLMAQDRYDEARKAFEAAFNLAPGRSTGPNGLAEVRLRKGIEPQEALEYAEEALQLYRSSKLEQRASRERLAKIRGNLAWALAVLGRADEARKAINAARADLDPRHIPENAAFHWRAGIVMQILGDHGASETHFFRAVKLDPGGYYGKLAAHEAAKQPA